MSLLTSFKHAARGIGIAFWREKNVQVQLTLLIVVALAGLYFGVTRAEWLAITVVSGLVLALELVNTTLEKMLDVIKPRLTDQAGVIKDIAAGAVLIASLTALIVASFIFIPHVIERW